MAAPALGRLLDWQRRARAYDARRQPDSATLCRRRALREAGHLGRTYPLERSAVLAELGMSHFAALRLDSAGRYLRAAAATLAAAPGLDLRRNQFVRRADGQTEVPGRSAAGRYANAGLTYRRRRELTAALGLYDRALALQRILSDEPGLRWTQCLLGEAYADQGDTTRALAYYAQAAATARRLGPTNAAELAGQLNDVLNYARPLLVARRRFGQVHEWARAARAPLRGLVAAKPALSSFPTQWAKLAMHEADAFLAENHPDSAAAALAAADSARAVALGCSPTICLDRRVRLHLLRAHLSRRQGTPPPRVGISKMPSLTSPPSAPPPTRWPSPALANSWPSNS